MGFPSRRARTRASNRAPGEILVTEWKGTDIEKALVSIHPDRFDSVEQVALSTLFVIGNEVYGSRRNLGATTLGVEMDKATGDLVYTQDEKGQHAQRTLAGITKSLGNLPQGFTEMPEPKQVQRNRQLKYACNVCGTIIRSAGQALESLCLHGGKPEHGSAPGSFVLQVPKSQQPKEQPAAQAAAVAEVSPTENIKNVMTAVKAGVAKVVHGGRLFGQEASV